MTGKRIPQFRFGWMDKTDFLHELENTTVKIYAAEINVPSCCQKVLVKITEVVRRKK